MKKIMFIIGCLGGGGAERIVTNVASFMAEKTNFEISILTYYKEENEYAFSSKINRINISGGNKNSFVQMNSIQKLKKIRHSIKDFCPDDIICFLPHALVFTYLSLLFTKFKKKIVYAERANPKIDNSKIGKLKNKILKKIKRIITQNSGQKEFYNKITKAKVDIIPNPLYEEIFTEVRIYSKKPKKIVSVGRLNNQKNYELAIKSFYELQKQHNDLEYYIYGSGSKKEELENLVFELNIENKVHFMGFEIDRNKIYGDKDIYLMTSLYEGMPNTLAEAMCYGLPSISTNCDFGPADLIMDDKMGILVDGFDNVNVVNALNKMINNYDFYIKNVPEIKEKLYKKYSYEIIMKKWISYFSKGGSL